MKALDLENEARDFFIKHYNKSYADFWCMEEKGSCGVIC